MMDFIQAVLIRTAAAGVAIALGLIAGVGYAIVLPVRFCQRRFIGDEPPS